MSHLRYHEGTRYIFTLFDDTTIEGTYLSTYDLPEAAGLKTLTFTDAISTGSTALFNPLYRHFSLRNYTRTDILDGYVPIHGNDNIVNPTTGVSKPLSLVHPRSVEGQEEDTQKHARGTQRSLAQNAALQLSGTPLDKPPLPAHIAGLIGTYINPGNGAFGPSRMGGRKSRRKRKKRSTRRCSYFLH